MAWVAFKPTTYTITIHLWIFAFLRDVSASFRNFLLPFEYNIMNSLNISEAQFEIAHLNHHKRRKRSLLYDDQDLVGLKKHLHVKPAPRSLLDPQFLLLRRRANATEAVDHSDDIDRCHFRSEHAALFACGDLVRLDKLHNYFVFCN